jgi:hypothetical protein
MVSEGNSESGDNLDVLCVPRMMANILSPSTELPWVMEKRNSASLNRKISLSRGCSI